MTTKQGEVYPLCNGGGSSGLFLAFPKAAGLRDGDEENDRALKFHSKVEVRAHLWN